MRSLKITVLGLLLVFTITGNADIGTCSKAGCSMNNDMYIDKPSKPYVREKPIIVHLKNEFSVAQKKGCFPKKRPKKHHRHRRHHPKVAEAPIVSRQESYACNDNPIIELCDEFPRRIIRCETVNPADLVDSDCKEFIEKLKKCEPYTCQAPYALDPTIKTNWQILGKNANRCIVSNTTEDVGIKDTDGYAIPITQMCEYDEIGVRGLIERFMDQESRYYHYSTCRHFEGAHNCSMHSRGVSIKEAMHKPAPEIDIASGGS